MAETSVHDVVKVAQSVGTHQEPSDVHATTSNDVPAGDGQATTTTPSTTTDSKTDSKTDSSDAKVNDANGSATTAEAAEVAGKSAPKSVEAELGGNSAANVHDGAPASQSMNETLAQTLADASGGSDTDVVDASKDDGKGHARTGSVKKPASFKSVSITKNFLKTTASPAPTPGDKSIGTAPSPVSVLQSAKPRLVAKSALSGMGRGLTKMNGTGGPDASKVWNKNRPAPPAPPRQFTDEELQTRYGIHMTARLQSDEAGKDSKWADIDDDEDDWAPETVEWMDGTKSNVGVTEAQQQMAPPARQDARVPSPSNGEKPTEAVKPVLTAMHKQNTSQSTKTILRPGAQLNSSSPKPGLAHKASDKNVLTSAKPAAPPTKSPWAVLPPVENLAPINPPVQSTQRPFQRDPSGFDGLPPAPSPAQEIAADDFSRSLRDDRGTKELFNANSGRYEPAGDARRNSRNEHGYRQPAVLQRPPPGASSNGPAEPSAAFQTHRSSIEGGAPWSRRRASSSLSAGGGRRPSLGLSQDYAHSPHNDIAVESPKATFAHLDRPGPWVRGQHPPTEPPLPENQLQPHPQEPIEDPVAKQQRLMKEKIERARAAKQKQIEAEAAEAAARQERLKLKMAQLAAASPSPDAAAKEPVNTTTATQPSKSNTVSPPKPPVPTSEGEVAQYGMMKVHQPHPVKKNHQISEASLTSKSNQDLGGLDGQGQGYRNSVSPSKPVSGTTASDPPRHPAPGERVPQKGLPNAPNTNAPLEKLGAHQGTWKTSPAANDYNWSSNTMASRSAPGASVWGPPGPLSNSNSLGNGTFDSNFSHPNLHNRFDNRIDNSRGGGISPQGPIQAPIGSGLKSGPTPPSHSQRTSNFAQTFQAQQEQLPIHPAPSHSPSVDDQAFASAHLDSSLQQSIAQTSSLHPQAAAPLPNSSYNNGNMSAAVAIPPSAIGASRASTHTHAQNWVAGSGQAATKATWASFPQDEKLRMQHNQALYQNDLRNSSQAALNSVDTSYEVYREASGNKIETWRVVIQQDGTKDYRNITTSQTSPNNRQALQRSLAQHPEDHAKIAEKLAKDSGASSSRFFPKPQAAPVSAQVSVPAINLLEVDGDEVTAPPPADEDLFDRNAPVKVNIPTRPQVRLPGRNVTLPPRSPGLDKAFTAGGPAPATRTKPGLMHASDLAAKFGPLGIGANAFSNTKPQFDVTSAHGRPTATRAAPSASPASKHLFATDQSSSPISKSIAEDECIDLPDFGSTPTVRVPTMPHANHQFGYSHDSGMLTQDNHRLRQWKSQLDTQLKTQSKHQDERFLIMPDMSKIIIKTPSMQEAKVINARRNNIDRRVSGGYRGGRGAYAPRGRGFSAKFENNTPSASSSRGRGVASRGGSSAVSSSSSSPKPRGGGWSDRSGAKSAEK